MDQNSGNGGAGASGQGFGGDDASRARDHVRAAEENRDALAAQNQRTGSTTPGDVDMPRVDGGHTGGVSATGTSGQASEDPMRARAHVRAAEENRDALAAQNQRTGSTTSPDVDMPRVDGGRSGGMSAAPGSPGTQGSGDPSMAREHVRAAEENRDALADENRRVENTTPPDVGTGR